LLPHSRNEGAIIVYLAKGIPEQNALRHLFFFLFLFSEGRLQRSLPVPVPLRHLFTSDSASSTPDWISDSFCFFFSAEIPPNQQNNQQKRGLPNGIKKGESD